MIHSRLYRFHPVFPPCADQKSPGREVNRGENAEKWSARRIKSGPATVCLLAICMLVVCSSCSNKPKDYPAVFPCSVTVTKGLEPIADAELSLVPTGEGSSLAIGAMTDAQGVAEFTTRLGAYAQRGVPNGTWKITIVKAARSADAKTPEEVAAMSEDEATDYNRKQLAAAKQMLPIVPYILGEAGTTPLELTVSGQMVKLAVDISKYKDSEQKRGAAAPIE